MDPDQQRDSTRKAPQSTHPDRALPEDWEARGWTVEKTNGATIWVFDATEIAREVRRMVDRTGVRLR